MDRTVEYELHELKGVFPGLTRNDFYRLDNGNICRGDSADARGLAERTGAKG